MRPGIRRRRRLRALLLLVGATLGHGLVQLAPVAAQEGRPAILERTAGIELAAVTLEDALRALQRSTGVGLVYSPDLIPVDRRVDCPCTETTLAQALDRLLRGTRLAYRATETQIRIIPSPPLDAQSTMGTIAGRVTSQGEGDPIPNALIRLSDGRGSLTNEHGRFVLVNIPPGSYTLEVSGLGWDPAEVDEIAVEAGETVALEVVLTRRVIPLSSIVVSPGTFGIMDEVSDFALQTLTRGQIQTVPQVGEDVFRSLKRLPGVASGDISTRLHLRGGTDREVLVQLDGMELYEPYHLKDFEGALGIVDVNAVGGIDLHTGGFGVDFGNHMAGVFDMESRSPPQRGARTTLGLSLTNLTAMSQGAFAQGKGQWLVSARRGYLDFIMEMTDANDDIDPRYYDVLAKVRYQLGSKHIISAHLLHAGDNLDLDPEALADDDTTGELETGFQNSYGWITWKAFFSPRVRMRTVVSAGRISQDRSGFMEEPGRVAGPEFADVFHGSSFDFLGIKQEWNVDFTDRVAARAGISLKGLRAQYDYRHLTRTLEVEPSGEVGAVLDSVGVSLDPSGTEFGSFAALRFRPVGWATGELGIRYDRHTHTGDSDISPRLHGVFDLGPRTTLRASWGRYHQSQGIQDLEVSDQETVFSPSEEATQISAGVEHEMANGITGRLELYSRSVDRPLRVYFNRWREILAFPEIEGDRIRLDPTRARARGMEILARRDGDRWDWSASYSLSSTEDRVEGEWVPRFMDQRHAFTLTVGFRPGRSWNVSGAWQVHSGWPYTPQIIVFDTVTAFQDQGLDSTLRWNEEFGPVNSSRLPAYHRLDLRVTRRFTLRRGVLDVYLDLFNAYNQTNLRSYDYGTQTIGNDLKYMRWPDEELLPLLPSIGLRWEF